MDKYVTVNAEIGIDDVLGDLTNDDKQELVDELYENEDFVPTRLQNSLNVILSNDSRPTTNELELKNILNNIYNNRNFLNEEDKQLLIKLSNKGLY